MVYTRDSDVAWIPSTNRPRSPLFANCQSPSLSLRTYYQSNDERNDEKLQVPHRNGSLRRHEISRISSVSNEIIVNQASSIIIDPCVDEEKCEDGNQSTEPSHGRLLPLGQFLIVYACLALAVLLTSLDQTIVACILPSISTQFTARDAPWVGIAYLLTQTTCSPLYGRMSDVFGRKALFLIAHSFFFVGTIICAAAPTMLVLIIGRAVAGIGGAGLFSMVHICVSDIVTLRKRGTYHGILSVINGAGAAAGPLIGGLFASTGEKGWRMSFWFQVPIIGVAAIATAIVLPKIGESDMRLLKIKIKTVDYLGSILFVGGSTVFLLGLLFIKPPIVPVISVQVLTCLFSGAVILILFFTWEGKFATMPIVPLQIFKNTSVDMIFVLNFAFGYIFFAILYYVPQFFQVASGQDAVQSSVTLLPVVVANIFLSWGTGLCTSIYGKYKISLVIGFALVHVGSVLLYIFFKPGVSQALSASILLILGIGIGCQMQNTLIACQSATRQREVAMATAVRNFFRNIGGVVGIAISGMIIHIKLPEYTDRALGMYIPEILLDEIEDDPLRIHQLAPEYQQYVPQLIEAYSDTLRIVFLVFIPLSALAAILVVFLPEYKLDRDENGEPVKCTSLVADPISAFRASTITLVDSSGKRRSKAYP